MTPFCEKCRRTGFTDVKLLFLLPCQTKRSNLSFAQGYWEWNCLLLCPSKSLSLFWVVQRRLTSESEGTDIINPHLILSDFSGSRDKHFTNKQRMNRLFSSQHCPFLPPLDVHWTPLFQVFNLSRWRFFRDTLRGSKIHHSSPALFILKEIVM